MKIIRHDVIVVARDKENLLILSEPSGPLAVPCGTAGPSIAKQVLEGNGKANIPMEILKLAIDTQYGLESIHANFELYDPKTQKPLLWSLINQRLNAKN